MKSITSSNMVYAFYCYSLVIFDRLNASLARCCHHQKGGDCCPHVRNLSFDDNNNVLKTHELSNGCYKYFRMSGNSILIPAKIAQSLKKEPKPNKEVKVFLWKNGRPIWKTDVRFRRLKPRQKQVWGLMKNGRPILEIGRPVFKKAEASVFPVEKRTSVLWKRMSEIEKAENLFFPDRKQMSGSWKSDVRFWAHRNLSADWYKSDVRFYKSDDRFCRASFPFFWGIRCWLARDLPKSVEDSFGRPRCYKIKPNGRVMSWGINRRDFFTTLTRD